MSPVVVGYDLSRSSSAALHRAVTLAAHAPVHVLHVMCVVDPKDGIPSIPSYSEIDEMYAARVQAALTAEIEGELDQAEVSGRVHFFVHVRIGEAAHELLELARELRADLIIVGSRGVTGLDRLLVGSTSERVVRDAGCAVEVARAKQYAEVEPIGENTDDGRLYVPPHRYTYEHRRANLRPAEWPLS